MNVKSALQSGGALAVMGILGLGITAQAAGNPGRTASTSPAPTGISVPPNSPAPTPTGLALAVLKARCAAAVSRREVTLTSDAQTVNASDAIDAQDRTTLLSLFSSDAAALTALNATIQADTTFASAKANCELIVSDYRVYVLVGPKMNLTLAAGRADNAATEFATISSELQADLNNSSLTAAQKAAAQQAINDLNSKIAATRSSVAPVSGEVLALTPAGYPGNVATLEAAHTSIASANQSLKGSMADVNTVLKALGQ